MKFATARSFQKDIRSIRDKSFLTRLAGALEEIAEAKALESISNIVAMSGNPGYYRIRIGDYRLGFEVRGDEIVLLRCLHRREIYRHFP